MKYLLRKNILQLITNTQQTKPVRLYLPSPISVTLSIFTVSAFIFLTLTPHMSVPFNAIPQHITISSIHCTFEKPSLSLLVRHSAVLLWSTDKDMVTLGFLILPAGVRTWTLVKSHSPYSCSKWFWMVSSPLRLAPAVVRSSPLVWPQGLYSWTYSNCEFNFWCYMTLKYTKDCHPPVLCSTPPTTKPSIQPLRWHLTTGTVCSCSLGTFLWFRITCGGNLLLSANSSNITVTQ
jgi:hypothetical protein